MLRWAIGFVDAFVFCAKNFKYVWRTVRGRLYIFRDAPIEIVEEWAALGEFTEQQGLKTNDMWDVLSREARAERTLRIRQVFLERQRGRP